MFDGSFREELRNRWNERLQSMRIIGFIVSIALIAVGITCIFIPMLSVNLMHYIFASVLLAAGIFHIVNYFTIKTPFRSGGYLAMAIIQVIVALILFFSPSIVTIEILAFMLSFEMLISGIDAFSLGVKVGSAWGVFIGIMNRNVYSTFRITICILICICYHYANLHDCKRCISSFRMYSC